MKDIDVHDLTVRLGATTILHDIDVEIERGKMLGIVGASGGGKSTLMRCLTGQIDPARGTGTVLGFDIHRGRRAIQQHVGYIPQADDLNMYGNLSAIDNIQLMGTMHDPTFFLSREGQDRIHTILDILDINPSTRTLPTDRLSGGERKRVSIAMGIISKPPLLFLDEPTTGLDEHLKNTIFNYLKKINKQLGITMCLAEHNLLICEMVDQIIIMKQGQIVASGKPMDLLRSLPSEGTALTIRIPWVPDLDIRFEQLPFVWKYLRVGRDLYKFFCDEMPYGLASFFDKMHKAGIEPQSIVIDDATLLDYFLLRV